MKSKIFYFYFTVVQSCEVELKVVKSEAICTPERDSDLGHKKPNLHLRAIISDLDHSTTKAGLRLYLILKLNNYQKCTILHGGGGG